MNEQLITILNKYLHTGLPHEPASMLDPDVATWAHPETINWVDNREDGDVNMQTHKRLTIRKEEKDVAEEWLMFDRDIRPNSTETKSFFNIYEYHKNVDTGVCTVINYDFLFRWQFISWLYYSLYKHYDLTEEEHEFFIDSHPEGFFKAGYTYEDITNNIRNLNKFNE